MSFFAISFECPPQKIESRYFVRNARIIPARLANDNENYCGAPSSCRRVSLRCETMLASSKSAETVIEPVNYWLPGFQEVEIRLVEISRFISIA